MSNIYISNVCFVDVPCMVDSFLWNNNHQNDKRKSYSSHYDYIQPNIHRNQNKNGYHKNRYHRSNKHSKHSKHHRSRRHSHNNNNNNIDRSRSRSRDAWMEKELKANSLVFCVFCCYSILLDDSCCHHSFNVK